MFQSLKKRSRQVHATGNFAAEILDVLGEPQSYVNRRNIQGRNGEHANVARIDIPECRMRETYRQR